MVASMLPKKLKSLGLTLIDGGNKMTYKDFWYKPYDPEAVEFNETARKLAEERDSEAVEINEAY